MPLGNAIILADFFFSLPSYSLVVLRGFFFLSLSLVCLGRTFFFFISLVQQYTSLPFPSHLAHSQPHKFRSRSFHIVLLFFFLCIFGFFFFRVFQKFHSHGVHPRFKVCSLFPFVSYGPSSSHRSRNPCKDRSLLYSYIDVSNYTIPHLPLCFFSLYFTPIPTLSIIPKRRSFFFQLESRVRS